MNAPRFASKSWRMLAVAAIVAALAATAIRPALADEDGEGWGHGHHRGWYHHHHGYGYGYVYEPYAPPVVVYPPAPVYTYEQPAYVYAPPPVVYAPPVYASPSINFVFPLHVR